MKDEQEHNYVNFRHNNKKRSAESHTRYNDSSKQRLTNIIKKKFNTTIIGSLAAFEEQFGDLWGHGLAINDLDEDQRYWRDIWMDTRAKVLDNGNTNLRASESEISQYTLSWNRYVTNFNNHKDQ